MGTEETPRVDYDAPPSATHWKIKKRDENGHTWAPLSFQLSQGNADGSNVATVSVSLFPVGDWPRTLGAIVELLASRWGTGAFRVWFYTVAEKSTKQVGGAIDFSVQPRPAAAPPPAAETTTAPVQGAATPPFLGALAQMFGGPTPQANGAPQGAIPADPMSQAMLAFQVMLQWQRQQTEALRVDSETRAAREREERDRVHREELARTRDFFKELEKIRVDADRAREDAQADAKEEIEELRAEMKKKEEEARSAGGLPKGMEWLAIVERLGPSVGPVLKSVAEAAIKAGLAQGGAATAAVGAATGAATGGGT